MKTIISLFLGVLVLMAGCKNTPEEPNNLGNWGLIRKTVDVRFVDEAGNNLLDKSILLQTDENEYWLDKSKYKLYVTSNGITADVARDKQIQAYPDRGVIRFLCGIFEAGDAKVCFYPIVFSCPDLCGDNKEHSFALEYKSWSYINSKYFDRATYDGKEVLRQEEGDQVCFVIVVPQK